MNRQMMNVRNKSVSVRTTLAALLLTASATLMTGCATTAGSETEQTICRELRASLPTWSSEDSFQSRKEAAEFLDVFEAVCGGA